MEWRSGAPLLSAVAQARGSIPLHWAQRPDSSMLKPEIVLQSFDPLYAATRRHFDALQAQYGDPLCLLDLVKRGERRPREGLLGGEYEAAVRCGGALQPAGDRAAAPWLMIGVAAFPPLLQLLPKRGGRLPGTRRQIHPHLVLPGAVIERLLLCCAPTAAPTGKCLPMPLRSPPPQVPSVLEGRRDAAPQLYVAPDLAAEPLRSKALAFTSLAGARGVQEKSVDSDVLFTEVAPQVLASLQALLSQLVIPMVAGGGQVTAGSKNAVPPKQAESIRREFVQVRC